MDIKLRARLSAYSKIESISGINSNIPDPDALKEGHVLGVGTDGKYTLFGKVTPEDIDGTFNTSTEPDVATKDEIDNLFEEDQGSTEAVTKEEIDSLFASVDTVDSATKEEIDELFGNTTDTQVGTVSYADIDSLFK
jgi:hypothetical protein